MLAGNVRQKIETKQDLPAQELEESLGEAFALAAEDAELREDEEPAALSRALVAKYMADAAPSIQPRSMRSSLTILYAQYALRRSFSYSGLRYTATLKVNCPSEARSTRSSLANLLARLAVDRRFLGKSARN